MTSELTKYALVPLFSVIAGASWPAWASVRLPVKLHLQEHELSCEAAALKMVLNFHEVPVTEAEVIKKIPFDPTVRRDNVWGDPEKGFVGNIDGKMGESGYGIHWGAMARVASNWKKTVVLENKSASDLAWHLDNKRPIIVWIVMGEKKQEISWKTSQGKKVFALMNEHTQVVYGYEGTREAPRAFYIMDPREGPLVKEVSKFLNDWDSFGRKGIVVYR